MKLAWVMVVFTSMTMSVTAQITEVLGSIYKNVYGATVWSSWSSDKESRYGFHLKYGPISFGKTEIEWELDSVLKAANLANQTQAQIDAIKKEYRIKKYSVKEIKAVVKGRNLPESLDGIKNTNTDEMELLIEEKASPQIYHITAGFGYQFIRNQKFTLNVNDTTNFSSSADYGGFYAGVFFRLSHIAGFLFNERPWTETGCKFDCALGITGSVLSFSDQPGSIHWHTGNADSTIHFRVSSNTVLVPEFHISPSLEIRKGFAFFGEARIPLFRYTPKYDGLDSTFKKSVLPLRLESNTAYFGIGISIAADFHNK